MVKPLIHSDWQAILEPEFQKEYFKNLMNFVDNEYQTQTIYPKYADIFQAFELTPFEKVKVVILGQDPYHGPNQAHGLSFSVKPGIQVPPSLQNIYKELHDDVGFEMVHHGYLKHWATQGVLMLNSVLTVRDGQANSHQNKGWEQLTDTAIQYLSKRPGPIVFILWGKSAQQKIKLIDQSTNIILKSVHPSPLSAYRGFFGSKPFSKTNTVLQTFNETPIDWQLPVEV